MIPLIYAHGAGAAAEDPPLPELRARLGGAYAVSAPDLGPPDAAAWGRSLKALMTAEPRGAVLVGHSLGASMILKCLAELGPAVVPRDVVGLAAPFWGLPGWEEQAFALPPWAPEALARVPVRLFHARDDAVVPVSHLAEWGRTLPGARLYPLDGGGHAFDGNLVPVAAAIAEL